MRKFKSSVVCERYVCRLSAAATHARSYMALRARSCVSFGESSVQLRRWPAATWSGLIEQWRLQESHTLLFYGRASLIGAASTVS